MIINLKKQTNHFLYGYQRETLATLGYGYFLTALPIYLLNKEDFKIFQGEDRENQRKRKNGDDGDDDNSGSFNPHSQSD